MILYKKSRSWLIDLLCSAVSFAQNPNSIFKIDSNYLSKESFSIFTNRTFGQLATGNNTANLANFGSFEALNGTVNFNAFTPLSFKRSESNGSILYLSLEVKGDLALDNTAILFSNSRLNTNIDAGIKIHYPISYFNEIGFRTSEKKKLIAQKISLQQDFDLQLSQADTNSTRDRIKRTSLHWQLNSKRYEMRLKRDSASLLQDTINQMLGSEKPDTVKLARSYLSDLSIDDQLRKLSKDSLQYEKEIAALDTIIALTGNARINHIRKIKSDLIKEFNASLQALELKAPLTRARLIWITGKVVFNKKKYYDYDTTRVFPDRIQKHTPTYFSGGVELNYYVQSGAGPSAHYVNFGMLRRQDNNINDLATSALTQKTKTALNGVEREVLKT